MTRDQLLEDDQFEADFARCGALEFEETDEDLDADMALLLARVSAARYVA